MDDLTNPVKFCQSCGAAAGTKVLVCPTCRSVLPDHLPSEIGAPESGIFELESNALFIRLFVFFIFMALVIWYFSTR